MSNQMLNVWVDADSCPVKAELSGICQEHGIRPNFIASINHFQTNADGGDWTYVDTGSQEVDLYIINHSSEGDIVITQDLSLAVLLTSKGVYVLTPRGKLVKEEDAFNIMDTKYIRQKAMVKRKKWKGPSAFTTQDRKCFADMFEKLILSIRKME